MTAVDLNQQVLEQLGRGDAVAAREMLKSCVLAILQALDEPQRQEDAANLAGEKRVEGFMNGISAELEGFLAVAAPLIEYGGRNGQQAVVYALALVAGEVSDEPSRENALYLIAARLLWCTTAFALACDATDFLPRLLRITTHSAFRDADERLIDDSGARHPSAYDRSADVGFESHRLWLGALPLVQQCYPLLARDQQLDKALMEADMLFAMHADVAGGSMGGTYSHGAHREGYAEQRLRARVGAPDGREQLCRFFDLADAQLEQRLNELHEGLRRQRDLFMGEVRLFPSNG
jgi:hypothetical protein